MPWVEKRENGYRLVVDLGQNEFGKRIRKTKMVYTSSKKQAEKELRKYVVELEEKGYDANHKPEKLTIDQLIDKYIELFVISNLEITTQSNYIYQINAHIRPGLGKFQLDKVTSLHIVEFLNNMKSLKKQNEPAGNQTKIYVYRILKSIFLKASEWYGLDKNPMDKVSRPKEDKPTGVNVYDEKEANEVFEKLQNERAQFKVLVSLAFTTGMRKAELLGLEWQHINLDKSLINIRQSIPAYKNGVPVIKSPKTKGSIRTVSIPASIVTELEEYKKEWFKFRDKNIDIWETKNEFLFCNKTGMPYYPKTLGDQWRSFVKRNDIRHIRFHDIRHTSVTILINRGIHAKIISERIGHSKIGTTMDVYGHVIRAADASAAALFDQVFSSTPATEKEEDVSGGKKGGK